MINRRIRIRVIFLWKENDEYITHLSVILWHTSYFTLPFYISYLIKIHFLKERANNFVGGGNKGKLNLTSVKQVKSTILVCSGCYNRLPYTGGLINNGNLFLIVLEVGSPRSRHWDIHEPTS